jgi:polysaccharide chain length determinant protein (PEP-CTERM system associated)
MATKRTGFRPFENWDLLQFAEVPLRRKWHVAIPFALILGAALAAAYTLSERFRSTTVILVESEKVPDSFVKNMATETAGRRLVTLKQEVLSRTRLEKVIKELDPYPEAAGGGITRMVEAIRDRTTVTVKGTDSFSISFVHRDPRKAMEVTNRLATLFIEEKAESRGQQVEDAYTFIDAQVQEAQKELEAREQALRRYKEQRMGTLPEQLNSNLATLQALQLEQQTIGQNLRAALERQTAIESSPVGASALAPDPELTLLKTKLSELRLRYTDAHPDVRAVLAQIARVEESMSKPVGSEPGSGGRVREQLELLRTEVRTLQAKRQEVEGRIVAIQARVESTPRTEQELATLTRDYQKLKDNYLALLNKKLDARMSERLEKRWKGEQFRILDPAHFPDRRDFPNRMLFGLLGLFFGLLAGLGTAFAVEVLDHSIRTAQELESLLPYKVLATIPDVSRVFSGRPRPLLPEARL